MVSSPRPDRARGPIDTPASRWSRTRFVLVAGGLFVVAIAAVRVPSSALAQTPSPDRSGGALVSWIDTSRCPRVFVQRVGSGGLEGDPREAWRGPCPTESDFTTIHQFHATADGRVLAFFAQTSGFSPVPHPSTRLVVLTLDGSGQVVSTSATQLVDSFVVDEEGNQIQIGASRSSVR